MRALLKIAGKQDEREDNNAKLLAATGIGGLGAGGVGLGTAYHFNKKMKEENKNLKHLDDEEKKNLKIIRDLNEQYLSNRIKENEHNKQYANISEKIFNIHRDKEKIKNIVDDLSFKRNIAAALGVLGIGGGAGLLAESYKNSKDS
jgi:hypothetical protein